MNQKAGLTVLGMLAILAILVVSLLGVTQAKQLHPRHAALKAVSVDTPKRYLLVHYLPWFEADPTANKWGWHWTMNHYAPGDVVNGHRAIASHYYPLIGPYDSNDPDVIEYHVLLMKLAGINGAVIDWYGTDNYMDYGTNHRNAQHVAAEIARAHMHFAALYEDEVAATRLVKDGQIPASQAVAPLFDFRNKRILYDKRLEPDILGAPRSACVLHRDLPQSSRHRRVLLARSLRRNAKELSGSRLFLRRHAEVAQLYCRILPRLPRYL